jgi:hypothetical protein
MQTFLPYKSFKKSAESLDMRRLGKQRVEVIQILNSIENNSGWKNHPAVKMWKGQEACLIRYGKEICLEWIKRGYKDTCLEKLRLRQEKYNAKEDFPYWLGNKEFHLSHQSNLIRKDSKFYRPIFLIYGLIILLDR